LRPAGTSRKIALRTVESDGASDFVENNRREQPSGDHNSGPAERSTD
jgi:hypothetical protein